MRYTAAELLAEERAIIDLTPARSPRARRSRIQRGDTAELSPISARRSPASRPRRG